MDNKIVIKTKSSQISIIDRYKPTKISQIIGNNYEITKIVTWIDGFKNQKAQLSTMATTKIKKRKYTKNKTDTLDESLDSSVDIPISSENISEIVDKKTKKSCLLITGEHGIGKTCLVEVILKEKNFDKIILNFENIKNSKNIKDYLDKIVGNNNIINSMNSVRQKNIAIVIDELESITSTTEKACIMTLLKMNDESWFCPIILISNNQHNKFLSETKKNSIEVRLNCPSLIEIESFVAKIIKRENIVIGDNKVIGQIIDHSQRDIRRLMQILQDIKHTYDSKPLTQELMVEYCNLSKKKDVDFNLFSATSNLLYNYKNIDDCLRYYETEKVLLPLMIHYNYPMNIRNSNNYTYKVINKISESLSHGDVIENYIYGDQNWDINEVHGIYTCVLPSYYMSTIINKNYYKKSPLFTTDLNKTSIKKINRKNVLNANKCFTNSNISDYMFMTRILKSLIYNKKTSEYVKLLEDYNIKLDHLESVLKIDKIESETNVKKQIILSSKQKKELQNIFES